MKLRKPSRKKNEKILALYVSENCTNGIDACCGVGGKDQCTC